jgi:hypothetical protein
MKRILFFLSVLLVFLSGCGEDNNPGPGTGSVYFSLKVVNPYNEYQEGAYVYLYANQTDYNSDRNAIGGYQITDQSGYAYYNNLQETTYFIKITKSGMSNRFDKVTTPPLRKGNNTATYVIDY